MPHPRPHLQPAPLRPGRAPHQGDRRDPAPAGLHGRLPVDDGPRHVHHQRRRAGRREPARPLAGRLLRQGRGPHLGPRPLHGEGHPEPRRLARVRDRRPRRPALGQGGPQAQDRRHHPAARGRLRARRGDRGALRLGRRQPRAPLRRVDARQGPHQHPGRGPHRGLQEAAPRRPADRRQRPPARREPLLQLPPLRPRAGRPLQVQQEARHGRRPDGDRAPPRGRRPTLSWAGRSPGRTSPRSSAS